MKIQCIRMLFDFALHFTVTQSCFSAVFLRGNLHSMLTSLSQGIKHKLNRMKNFNLTSQSSLRNYSNSSSSSSNSSNSNSSSNSSNSNRSSNSNSSSNSNRSSNSSNSSSSNRSSNSNSSSYSSRISPLLKLKKRE